MIEKVYPGDIVNSVPPEYCVCGCTCGYGNITQALQLGDSAAQWDYAG